MLHWLADIEIRTLQRNLQRNMIKTLHDIIGNISTSISIFDYCMSSSRTINTMASNQARHHNSLRRTLSEPIDLASYTPFYALTVREELTLSTESVDSFNFAEITASYLPTGTSGPEFAQRQAEFTWLRRQKANRSHFPKITDCSSIDG